jgi:hypothetical protein
MHSVLNIFTRKASIVAFLSFVLLLTFIQQSCRKTDLGQTSLAKEEAFFRTTSNDPNVLRLIASLKAQNERTGFVDKLPKNSGAPIWDKYVMRSKKIDKSIFWRGLNGEPDSVVVIPFTSNNENLSAIIVYDSSTVSPSLNCYTTNGNLYAVCHNANVDIDKAEQMLAMFLQMENRVFGTTVFYHIPAKIFKNPALPDTATSEKMLVIDTVTVQGFAADDCFVIKYCNPGGVCTPPTYCDNCSVCPWIYYCDTPPGDGGGGGGGGTGEPPTTPTEPPTGGGGGGGTPPTPPEPCPFGGAWYNFVPSTEPCGPTNPPIPPTEDPPYFTLVDVDADSVSNPCVKGIITQMGSPAMTSFLIKLYQKTQVIPNNDKVSLMFIENNSLVGNNGNPTAGHTDVNTLPDGTREIKISLNPSYMANASKEFVATVILHELIHGFRKIKAPNLTQEQQHQEILEGLAAEIATSLHDIFPNLLAVDAVSLSLQGLEDVTLDANGNIKPTQNQIALDKYSIPLATAMAIAQTFFNGSEGTPC